MNNNNRRPTTFNPCVANTNIRRANDENTLLQQQQYNSYNSKYEPFQSREILRDVTNSASSNQRNVMMQQGVCSQQQQPLKPNTIGQNNYYNSQNNIPKKPSSANLPQQTQPYKNVVQQTNSNTTTIYNYGQRPLNAPNTYQYSQQQQQPITLQQHHPQYNNSSSNSRGFLPQHSSISNLSNGKVGAKIDIQTTRQKNPASQQPQQQQLREDELFAPGFNEVYQGNYSTTSCGNQQTHSNQQQPRCNSSQSTTTQRSSSTIPSMAAARPQINNNVNKNRQTSTNNVKNTSTFPSSKRDANQFDAVRYAEQSIEEDEDEEMAYFEDEEELTENNTIPIVPSIGVGYSVTSAAVASGYMSATSVFANPSSTSSVSQSSSYFSQQQHSSSNNNNFVAEDPANTSYESDEEPQKEPTNLLPSMQPLYYFREHHTGSGTINASTCNILVPPPTNPEDARCMRSVIFATDVEAEVLESMRLTQMKNKPNPRYMETVQTDITSNMRCILVDWMNEVASMYTLSPETLYLAVNILDRSLSKMSVRRNKLQAFGVASLFISSKFNEITPPELNEFIYIADDTYGKEEVLIIERIILNNLEFELVTVQPYDFIEKFLQICGVVDNPIVKYLTYYICEMQLQNIEVLNFPPSVIAASALMISLYLIDFNYWNSELACCFGFSNQACQGNSSLTPEDEQLVGIVNECLSSMFRFYVGMATGRINFSAVRSKYCHMVFQGVGECTRKVDKEPPFIPSVSKGSNPSTSTTPNYHP